jgi:hypothetical protein
MGQRFGLEGKGKKGREGYLDLPDPDSFTPIERILPEFYSLSSLRILHSLAGLPTETGREPRNCVPGSSCFLRKIAPRQQPCHGSVEFLRRVVSPGRDLPPNAGDQIVPDVGVGGFDRDGSRPAQPFSVIRRSSMPEQPGGQVRTLETRTCVLRHRIQSPLPVTAVFVEPGKPPSGSS